MHWTTELAILASVIAIIYPIARGFYATKGENDWSQYFQIAFRGVSIVVMLLVIWFLYAIYW